MWFNNITWERTFRDTCECTEFKQTTCYSLATHKLAPTENNIKGSNKNKTIPEML